MNTNKSNQTVAQQMIQAFKAKGATVAASTFFGVPIREYFGEPQVNKAAATPLPFQVNREAAAQMVAEIVAMGAYQPQRTVFGIPIPDYFGRSEKGVWQKIMDDVTQLVPVS